MEGLDSSTADNFGRTVFYALNIVVTFSSIAYVGGRYFVVFTMVLFIIYFQAGKIFSAASRDMRRLDSVTKSPLYAIFSEAISGTEFCPIRRISYSHRLASPLQEYKFCGHMAPVLTCSD
jgi:hypothetical protein